MDYYVADTETTDAKPDAGVCEIGWLKIDENFRILEKAESLIDPEKPISPSASGVHGLVYEDVQHAPTLTEFFSVPHPPCYGRRIQGPITLIGHKISFDRKFFDAHVDGEIFELCTLRWARALYPDHEDHKLSTLMYALGLPRQGAHRVMADVETAYHLCIHLAAKAGMTLEQMATRSQQPLPYLVMGFGKHKGQPVSEVPKSYARWALNNMDLDVDVKAALQARATGKTPQ